MNENVRFMKLIGALTLVGGLIGVAPAMASAAPTVGGSGSFCVASTTSASPTECFSTFGASISYATSGHVSLSNSTAARYVAPSELGASTTSAATALTPPPPSVVLAIDYSGSGYTGSTLVWTGAGCSSTVGGNNIPSYFNDLTRSVAAYSGCATTLFANANYGSPAYLIGVNGAVSDMGSFDGTASSQLFCNYFGCA